MPLTVAQGQRRAFNGSSSPGPLWRCYRTFTAFMLVSVVLLLWWLRGNTNYSCTNCHVKVNTFSVNSSMINSCPEMPPYLVGTMDVVQNPPSLEQQEKSFPDVFVGGRDREAHLRAFIYHMHHMLRRQQLQYQIFVVEQAGKDLFNRGKLFNVGYLVASGLHGFECFIFHDVDMIPVNDHNLYTCSDHPRHLTVSVDAFHNRLPYQDFFGGACAMTKDHVKMVNGFSNKYWGWGGEDDDMFYRVNDHGLKVRRYSPDVAKYIMLPHKRAERSPSRSKLLSEATGRYDTDGLNNITYKKLTIIPQRLFTWILADLQE
ncbi:beta-1,4-N-acetylgalactosaminyltransferase bre-4-like isoform X2 [Ornithodoros turicata]|uniref:beta-1,4-N-acetylgalactosaminyltransferase bre-4-like isoform X2 n=1 Tax=Ornithodoros turicata TaxID=34597 RepID=UPI00313924FE